MMSWQLLRLDDVRSATFYHPTFDNSYNDTYHALYGYTILAPDRVLSIWDEPRSQRGDPPILPMLFLSCMR